MGSPQQIEVKPWDLFEPGFTYQTRQAGTFVKFLEQPDSQYFVILHADPYQMSVGLVGPNGNECIWTCQREYHKGNKITSREDAYLVVQTMRKFPTKMDAIHRVRLAAQVALFSGLEKRVR